METGRLKFLAHGRELLTPDQPPSRNMVISVRVNVTKVDGAFASDDSPEGPAVLDIVRAATDTAIDSSALANFAAFDQTMSEWRASLVRWRCRVPATDRQNYGVVPRWDCRDLIFLSVALISNNLAHCAPWC
jgi:hypothetical protein